jgi:mRNA interferase MazF
MPSYSKNEVILVRYPFSALSGVKVRPAIIVNAPHVSQDVFIVPLTSRTTSLLAGEVCPYGLGGSRAPRANGGETWAVYGARDAHSQTGWPADSDGCRAG